MKATDLMIGDWVKKLEVGGHYRKCRIKAIIDNNVDCVTSDGEVHTLSVNGIEPIPLTAEILQANGFDCSDEEVVRYNFIDGDYQGHFSLRRMYSGNTPNGWSFYAFNVLTLIDYVHELQHAFRLCGIEKEI